MPTPSPEELDRGLRHAEVLREQGEDTFYIAKSLLGLHYRAGFLEEVFAKADLYLHSGEGAHEHAELVKAIERARQALQAAGDEGEGIRPW